MAVLRQQAERDPVRQAQESGLGDEQEGVLATVGRFLGRPGYMARSLLRGDLEGFARNNAQFLLDLPTGGWINRNWSLANLFDDDGDLTAKAQRPEFTDLVGKTGNVWGDLALDVVGGALTDPLTFLPFAGQSKVAGTAVAGASRALAAPRLAGALAETAAGRAALSAARPAAVAELAAGRAGARLGSRLTPEFLASDEATKALASTMGPERAAIRVSRLRQVAEAKTVEGVLAQSIAGDRAATAAAAQLTRDTALEAFREAGKRVGFQLPEGLAGDALEAYARNPTLAPLWAEAQAFATRQTGFDLQGAFRKFGATALGKDPVSAGLRALEEGGSLIPDGALTFKIPLIPHEPVVLTKGGAFGKAAKALIPGKLISDAAVAAGSKRAIDMRRFVDERVTRAFSWAAENLYDKKAGGMLGQAAEDAAIKSGNLGARMLASSAAGMARVMGDDVLKPHVEAIGPALLRADGAFRQIMRSGGDTEALRAIEEGLDRGLAAAGAAPLPLAEEFTQGYNATQVRLMEKLNGVSRAEALAAGAQAGLPAERGAQVIDAFQADMARMARDLVREGVWDKRNPNPFYAPFMAGKDIAGWLARKPDQKVGQAVVDVFTKTRGNDTPEQFEEALRAAAAAVGMNAPETLQEGNLAALWARRAAAHAETMANVTLQRELRGRFPGIDYADPVQKYLARQFADVGPRQNALLKLIGGGKVLTKLESAKLDAGDAKEALDAGMRVVPHPEGGLAIERKWHGLNFFTKVALTSPFPSFYVRNLQSMFTSAAIDPDLGPKVAGQILGAMADAPMIRALTGRGRKTPEIASVIAQAVRNGVESLDPSAAELLRTSTVGKHAAVDVVRQAASLRSKDFSSVELFEAGGKIANLMAAGTKDEIRTLARVLEGKALVSDNAPLLQRLSAAASRVPATAEQGAQTLGGRAMATAANARNEAVRPLGAVNTWIEDSARVSTFVRLVENGMDPIRAQQKIARVFVNYDVQSGTERAVRDLIPFARYSIGSVPVTLQNTLRRPGAPIQTFVRTAVNRQPEEQFLPEHIRGRSAIQLGTDKDGNPVYASSLGLPFEPAADVLGIAARPFSGGLRRGLLAAAQPQLRAAAEAAVGQSFYFGGDPMQYRQAPRFLPDALTTATTLPGGRVQREIPGWVNHWLLGASPLSRFRTELDGVLDERLAPSARLADFMSGVRLQSVDQRTQARKTITRWLEEAESRGEVGKIENFFMRGEGDERLKTAIEALAALRKQAKLDRGDAPRPPAGVR